MCALDCRPRTVRFSHTFDSAAHAERCGACRRASAPHVGAACSPARYPIASLAVGVVVRRGLSMRSACILACLLFESFVNAQQLQWYAPGNVSPVLHGPWAYDSERDRLVIAGGYSQDGSHHPFYFRDTMEWDGVGWLARPSTSFPGRFAQQMAFDPRRRRIVMFGGLYQQPIISEHFPPGRLGDTWEYDGMQWSQRSNVGPSPRSGAAMTYDPVLQRVLLYGGNAYYNALSNETWAWDGASWTMLNVAGPPA